MIKPAHLTLPEILTQTEAWSEAIHIVEQQQKKIINLDLTGYDQIVYIGCGSTYYLSLSAAAVMQTLTGISARAFPSSEVLLSPSTIFPKGKRIALCAVSRSGTTTETIQAVEKFASLGLGDVVAITNGLNTPLSQIGKVSLVVPAGFDHSIAQTRSFSSMYLASTVFACIAGNQGQLSSLLNTILLTGKKIIDYAELATKKWGENLSTNQFFFLGSGIRYGLACEASLKLKEMSLTVSEPFHFLEFRHGPISMVDSKTMVVGLISEENAIQELAVLAEVEQLGGKTLTLGEQDAAISFNSGIPEPIRGVLYLPPLQLLALYRSLAKGLDADKPRNLKAVVLLDHIN